MEQKIYLDIQDLLGIGMMIMVLGIALSFGLQVLGELKSDMTASSYEQNATVDTIQAIAKIPAKLGTVASVVIIAVIIGVLINFLWVRMK